MGSDMLAVMHHRLASENHTLKRNMGVYIAEAQRAKRILQHSMQSRAAQQDLVSHDQHHVGSDHPQPAQLSQQHAQQECDQHSHSSWSPASWKTPQYSPSWQQTRHSESLPHHSQAESGSMTHPHTEPAKEGCSPCDKTELRHQHEAVHDGQAITFAETAQFHGSFNEGAGMGNTKDCSNAAQEAQLLAAAEASFASPSVCEHFHGQPAAHQLSQSECTVAGTARQHSHVPTDAPSTEQPHSDVRHTVHRWNESQQEDGNTAGWLSGWGGTSGVGSSRGQSGRSVAGDCESGRGEADRGESGRGGTADCGSGHDQATAACDAAYRTHASPVAAKFSFARWVGTKLDCKNLSTAQEQALQSMHATCYAVGHRPIRLSQTGVVIAMHAAVLPAGLLQCLHVRLVC